MGINKYFVAAITMRSDTDQIEVLSNDAPIGSGAVTSAAADAGAVGDGESCVDGGRRAAPVQWWRTYPASDFDRSHLRILRRALAGFVILGEPDWATRGEAATAIGVAIRVMRTQETSSATFDRIMTSVLVCTIEGNAAAALILSHVLARLAVNEPSFAQLGASWRTTEIARPGNLCRSDNQLATYPLAPAADAGVSSGAAADRCPPMGGVEGHPPASGSAARTGRPK